MRSKTQKMVSTALLMALGLVLPSFFHLFGAGPVFLPLHIPVLICGFVCGVPYGAVCGFLLPLLSSALTGMPVLFPVAISMSFELCIYGLASGVFYRIYAKNIYASLLLSMLCGRLVAGLVNAVLLGFSGGAYSLQIFITSSFLTGIPGMVIQIVIIPVLVLLLTKAHVLEKPLHQRKAREEK